MCGVGGDPVTPLPSVACAPPLPFAQAARAASVLGPHLPLPARLPQTCSLPSISSLLALAPPSPFLAANATACSPPAPPPPRRPRRRAVAPQRRLPGGWPPPFPHPLPAAQRPAAGSEPVEPGQWVPHALEPRSQRGDFRSCGGSPAASRHHDGHVNGGHPSDSGAPCWRFRCRPHQRPRPWGQRQKG